MSKKVRSAKGKIIDFSLLNIKQELSSKRPPAQSEQRKQQIKNKTSSRRKKIIENLQTEHTVDVSPEVADVEETPVNKSTNPSKTPKRIKTDAKPDDTTEK